MEVRALDGFAVGITATRRWEDQANLLSARGASVIHGPVLDVDVIGADAALRESTADLIAKPPDLTILCTGAGTNAWFAAAESFGAGPALAAALQQGHIVARGPKTMAAAITVGLDPPRHEQWERLHEVFSAAAKTIQLHGARIAVQLDGGEQTWLLNELAEAGADVVAVRIYRWTARADAAYAMRLLDATCSRRLDAVTFTSTPAADALFTMANHTGNRERLCDAFNASVAAVTVGPVTAATLRRYGVHQPLEPKRARLGAMIWALTEHLQSQRRNLRMAGHAVTLQGALAMIDGNAVRLSDQERHLLHALAEQPGRVIAKTALLQAAALDSSSGEHAIEMAIGRLRRKLGPAGAGLVTVFRRGYRLEVNDDAGIAPSAS